MAYVNIKVVSAYCYFNLREQETSNWQYLTQPWL